MSDKQALCSGQLYRGTIVLTVQTELGRRYVVIGAPWETQVQLYECVSLEEAKALVDAALLMIGKEFAERCCCLEQVGDIPACGLHGGPRLVVVESSAMQAV